MNGRFDPGELAVPANPWGTTVVLSLVLHVTGFILAFGLPRLLPRPAIAPVYIVDLVSLPGGPAAASPPAPAPAPPAATKAALPKVPKEEKAITLPDRNRKPVPKKTPVPKPTPARPKPTATPAKTSESTTTTKTETQPEAPPQAQGTPAHGASMSGVSGGTGATGGGFGGSGAAQTDLIQLYGNIMHNQVYAAWRKPIYPPTETRPALNATFLLTVASSGRVSKLALSTSSGYEAVDRSFTMAIQDAVFPPLPQGLAPSFTIQIEFTFTRD